jgi:hypothetical protein
MLGETEKIENMRKKYWYPTYEFEVGDGKHEELEIIVRKPNRSIF